MAISYPSPQRWGYSYLRSPVKITATTFNNSGQPTGSSTTNYTQAFDIMLRRDKRSSNPIRFVLPQRVPWRDPSSYVRTAIKLQFGEGTWTRKNPLNGYKIREWTGNGRDPTMSSVLGPHISASYEAIIDNNARNRLNTEVLQKLSNMKVDYGTALAETRSTVRGISSTFTQVARGLLAAKRGNWAGVANALRVKPKSLATGGTFSERWLEYQFGWMPLLSDIHGTYEILRDGLDSRGLIFAAVKSYEDEVEFSTSTANWDIKGSSKVSSRVKVYAAVDNQKIKTLANLGLLNPLQIGWELVPYSFVVDWFMPVGNLLEAFGATRGLTFVGGFASTRVSSRSSWVYRPESILGNVYEGEGFPGEASCEAYSRTKLTTFPFPALYFKSPFSTSHLTTATALLRQLIKSK